MPYYHVKRNRDGEYYLVERNFGHQGTDEGSSSHWTWHLTPRALKYLRTDYFGNPQQMPGYINDDQLNHLKDHGMLRKQDGAPIGSGGLYPSQQPGWSRRMAELEKERKRSASGRAARSGRSRQRRAPQTPARRGRQARPPRRRSKPATGFWGWLKKLLGL